jgi:hypothetical protein
MENQLHSFIVLYRDEPVMSLMDDPFGFQCWAEDVDHAEEQCINAYPDCTIVWVVQTELYKSALEDYYGPVEH